LWEWYDEICQPEPITFQEIKAWADISQRPLLYWEADILMQLDRLFRKVQHDGHRKPQNKGRQPGGKAR
jgi:hypothetical protein